LATENGFSKLNLQTTGFSFSRFHIGISKEKTSNIVNKDNVIREKSETKWHYKIAKIIINSILTAFSKGDTIKASFQKA
jgi:hypothetical protein